MQDERRPLTPAPDSGKAADDPAKSKQRLGAILVLLVAVLYVGSGVAIQLLFDKMEFEKPFFFSYVSVTLCSAYLVQPASLRAACCGRRRARSLRPSPEQLSLVNRPDLLLRSAAFLGRCAQR